MEDGDSPPKKNVRYSVLEAYEICKKIIRERGVGGLKCKIWQSAKSLLRKRFLGEDVELRE